MLQTGYRDPLPAAACRRDSAPFYTLWEKWNQSKRQRCVTYSTVKTPFPHISLGMNVVWSCRIVRSPWKKSNGWNKTYCKQGMLFTSSVSNSLYRQCYHLFARVLSVILYLIFLLSDIVNPELALHNASMQWCLMSWMEIYALVQGWPKKFSNEVYFCTVHVCFSARWISNSDACCLDALRYWW